MFETLKKAFKVKEIRVKIWWTLLFLLIYRIGCYIPVPGVGTALLSETDLTQTSYSTIPSVDMELGNASSDHSDSTLNSLADGLTAGVNAYFGN